MSRQKFFRGHRVKVGKMPSYMSHFDGEIEAIVIGSYSDQYGCGVNDEYTLLLLNKQGKPYGTASWYQEEQLTLIDNNRDKGEQIIQKSKRIFRNE